MKTLIAYATKYGTTKEYAEALARTIADDVTVVDLRQQSAPDLAAYDVVVVGTAIYYGRPLKEVKVFCDNNLNQLRTKRLGLFICCLIPDKAEAALRDAFPADLSASAAALGTFGGKIVMKRLSFGERLITMAMAKGGQDISSYSEEPLQAFAAALTGREAD